MQDNVTMVVTEDDGDDDESNDGVTENDGGSSTTTTTTTTTTVRPKMTYRNRFRATRGPEVYKKYAVRADKVVSLRDAEELYGGGKQRRRNAIEVDCRLRVPGLGTDHGRWKADQFYGTHKSVSYKYRGDQQTAAGDPFAAVSSASSMADDENGRRDGDNERNDDDDNNRGGRSRHASGFVQFAIVVGAAVVTVAALQ